VAENLVVVRLPFPQVRQMALDLGAYIAPGPEKDPDDESFAVLQGDRLLCVVPCFVRQGIAGWHNGYSIIPIYSTNEPGIRILVAQELLGRLVTLLQELRVQACKILTDQFLTKAIQRHPTLAVVDHPGVYGYFDLGMTPEEAWGRIRRSYRSLINRGERELVKEIFLESEQMPEEIIAFLLASEGVDAAKVELVCQRMSRAEEFLMAYRKDAEIIGVVGLAQWDTMAPQGDLHYDLGAYKHNASCPAHFCLYDAMCGFRGTRWKRVFLLHGAPARRGPDPEKLAKLDFFKRGYCTHLFTHDYCTLSLAGKQ
jgi:hypothetical protein